MNHTALYLYLPSILTAASSLFAMELPVAHSIAQSSAYTTASITPFSNSQSIKTDEILVNTRNELEQALTIINGLYKKIEHLSTQKNLDIDALIKQFAHDNCKTEINFGILKKIFDRLIAKSPDANCSWYHLGALVLYNARTNENHEYAYQCFHNTNPDCLDKLDKIKLAQFLQQLGENYFSGQFGCEENYDKARKCFEKIEQLNVPDCKKSYSRFFLGSTYFLRLKDAERNLPRSREYLLLIPNQNELLRSDKRSLADWLEYIGCSYFFGKSGCEQNYTKARECFEKVEQLDLPNYDKNLTWYFLGALYTLGYNVKINLPRAKEYLFKIPDNAFLYDRELASWYESIGDIYYFIDKQTVASWLEYIGYAYHCGEKGCEKNPIKAAECFEKIAKLNMPANPK